jgi:hypothetical protein
MDRQGLQARVGAIIRKEEEIQARMWPGALSKQLKRRRGGVTWGREISSFSTMGDLIMTVDAGGS